MLVESANWSRRGTRALGEGRQGVAHHRGGSGRDVVPRPGSSCLNAIHAGKHGIFLKGTDHETFWAW